MKKELIELKINGDFQELAVPPHRTLLDLLREELGLMGSKDGCNVGECGACTVLLDGEPVLSCLTLAVRCRGREVLTIEGLAREGKLHPLQEAFVYEGAVQCGYCTPGFIMMAKSMLDSNPDLSDEEIRDGLTGNLCRCTGYVKIIKAIKVAAEKIRLNPHWRY
jgi:carbon-monoxide dehydrogenase small subunit